MQRAGKVFAFEERLSDSPFVRRIRRTRSSSRGAFISVAVNNWQMCITRHRGRSVLTVRGPETQATIVPVPAEAEFVNIEFELGSYMPSLPVQSVVDAALVLPGVSEEAFLLDGAAWRFPDYENADIFVERLVREGVLVRDPLVIDALDDVPVDLSVRSVERRVVRATGLTRGTIRRIERASRAAALLERGSTILDTVVAEGFADQPHLTRSLKQLVGETPAEIAKGAM